MKAVLCKYQCLLLQVHDSTDSLLAECQTHDWKVANLNPGSSSGRIFLSRINFACWFLLFGVHSNPPILLQQRVKDPGHSAKSAGGRLHLNICIHPWPSEGGVGWLCHCPGIVWEPIRKRAHTQLVREHLDTVILARWAAVDWSWSEEWN